MMSVGNGGAVDDGIPSVRIDVIPAQPLRRACHPKNRATYSYSLGAVQ